MDKGVTRCNEWLHKGTIFYSNRQKCLNDSLENCIKYNKRLA